MVSSDHGKTINGQDVNNGNWEDWVIGNKTISRSLCSGTLLTEKNYMFSFSINVKQVTWRYARNSRSTSPHDNAKRGCSGREGLGVNRSLLEDTVCLHHVRSGHESCEPLLFALFHLMNTSGGSGGVIQPESNGIGVSAARLSGESLTGVKGRLFKIHSTSTMKVCSDSSSRLRSRNKNCRIFFADFTSAFQAPLSKETKEDWWHCNPLCHRESWIAAMDESACTGSVVCRYATFWQRSY